MVPGGSWGEVGWGVDMAIPLSRDERGGLGLRVQTSASVPWFRPQFRLADVMPQPHDHSGARSSHGQLPSDDPHLR